MPAPARNRATLFAVLALFIGAATAQKAAEVRPIQIENGKLLGVLTPDQKVIAYKGVPFAQPPVDELRWRPPQPVGKWKKILFARDFGSHCIQQGSYPDMVFHDPGPSEDCLTLNVWAPYDPKPTKKSPALPVMVWIYGGGFATGGTSENRQDGEFLAHRGVIIVSMNYRLGIFGFMALPDLSGESANHTSGNYGLMDQAAAIAWVRRNIAKFGGDPTNITVFGQSAGSMAVSALMASPILNGAFDKAIGESGAEFPAAGRSLPPREQAEQVYSAWADRAFGSSKLFYLRQLPADELSRAAMAQTAPRFGPIVDGYFLPDTLAHIYADGKQAHIPLLAGWVANECNPDFAAPPPDTFIARARTQFAADADKFFALYPVSTAAQATQSSNDYAGDQFIAFSTWSWLEAQTKTSNAPVYRYFFDLPSPGDRFRPASMGAFHSDDIEYVFGTLDSRPGMHVRPEDRALSEQMQQYWTNFAKSGDPNGTGLPKWPVYTPADNYQVMHLDATPAAQPDKLRPRYLFLEDKWSPTR
jgi:para-nitrobenzyl esterase